MLGWLAAAVMASPEFDPSWSRLPAGTEIPKLRTSTSRTYCNGDGTFTADITPDPQYHPDSESDAHPASTGHVGYFFAHDTDYYWRSTPVLRFRAGNYCAVAYAKFDLSSIPDSSKVIGALWHYYQFEYEAPESAVVTYYGLDPDSTGDSPLFFAIFRGVVLARGRYPYVGWVEQELNQSGVAIVQERLDENWISLGISPGNDFYGGGGAAYGKRGDSLQTYLRIEYTMSETCEPTGTPAIQPGLAFAPNPTTGRHVKIRYDISAGTTGKLDLRDVLGRTVRSYALNQSGSTRLDLRGFTPGVYMATLDAGNQSLTRKLVITAR